MKKIWYSIALLGVVLSQKSMEMPVTKDEKVKENIFTRQANGARRLRSLDIINHTSHTYKLLYETGSLLELARIAPYKTSSLTSDELVSGSYILRDMDTVKKYPFKLKYSARTDSISAIFEGKKTVQKVGNDDAHIRLTLEGDNLENSKVEIVLVHKERI